MRTIKKTGIAVLALLFTIAQPKTARSEDPPTAQLSPEQEEQAFAILDTLLPPKEKFDMKTAPPNGEVYGAGGSHYTFSPKIYVPRFGDADFAKEFISRLGTSHSRVMSQEQLRALPKDGQFFHVFEGRSYLPTFFIIRRITPKEAGTAEALVYTGAVGGAAERRILLDRSSGSWKIKENTVLRTFD